VPTIAEAGLPGYEFSSWFGFVAPAGVPDDVLHALNAGIRDTLKDPEIDARLKQDGAEPASSTPEEFAAFIRSEVAKWREVIAKAGIRAE
jgi:tripartite-type tricarboxylate transporter receptor subunit TctC